MKIFTASFVQETNTFAPMPTGMGNYEENGIYRGDGSLKAPDGVAAVLHFVRGLAEADGHEIVEGLAAYATPAGLMTPLTYQTLRDGLLDDLQKAMPVDAVQLDMHGAMAAEGCDDCEGDILSRIRTIVGPKVFVGAELDLHCHLTPLMLDTADAIVAFKEFPHTDSFERAEELYRILIDTVAGRVRPVTSVFDLKMVGIYPTSREPMKSFVKRMQSFEGKDGILSVSLGHCFPWGDVADAGAKLWVITDNAKEKGDKLARSLAVEFWTLRDQVTSKTTTIDAAIDRALAIKGPVVLSDGADNPGGGAPGDSTFILQRMIERGVSNAVLGPYWDLGAISICEKAGIGTTLDLRIGGKCGPMSGQPVDLRATIRAVVDDHSQKWLSGRRSFGKSIWLETTSGLHLLVTSLRNQIVGRDAFTGMGITLEDKQVIVVKSINHFYADFSPIASEVIYVSTPGALSQDFANIPYVKRPPNYWPKVENPNGF